jgi:hypothetical protein
MIARLFLLTGAAAALSFAATTAQAEMYLTETDVVAPTPSYVYGEPSYVAEDDVSLPRERVVRERIIREEVLPARERVIRRRVVAAPRERIIRQRTVTAPRERIVREQVVREKVIAPPEAVREDVVLAPPVTTGFTTDHSCFIDLVGRERCY